MQLELHREHNKQKQTPTALFRESVDFFWDGVLASEFLQSPPGDPNMQADLKTDGLKSRSDTAERRMMFYLAKR